MSAAVKTAPKLSPAQSAELFAKAAAAGAEAASMVVPEPMCVQRSDGSFYPPVMGGVCGFAWIKVVPGNSSFARWLRQSKGCSKAYGGGVSIWVSQYGQSLTLKEVYARAFAAVLRDAGIDAYAQSRMD